MQKISEEMRLKYLAAEQLGLTEKLMSVGWAGLTTQETGRIGGMVGALKKQRGKGIYTIHVYSLCHGI